MKNRKIIVIGAGPAGMIAAIRAKELGQEVVLIEKNASPGAKIILSGKGRCNLTNTADLESFLSRFSRQGQFLRDAFKKFFHPELIRFFEDRGLKIKVERQLRAFPVTDDSKSILEILKKELESAKVKIILGRAAKDIIVKDGRVTGVLLDKGEILLCDRLIIATGGVTYSFTGSTGDGINWARKLGHHITELRPGLVPLEVRQQYPRKLEGLTLKNIRLIFSSGKNKITSEIGELLFTRSGVSGPLALTLSGRIVDWIKDKRNVSLEIDLKPGLSPEQLNARLQREFLANSRRDLKNALKELLPARLIDVCISCLGIPPGKKAAYLTHEERKKMVDWLKGFPMDISGFRPTQEAMITRGGVSLKNIDPRTMESRLIKGLYFCGEMIDVDADTGGFNLQAAFSTGYLAGESAAQ
ncbi:MAG: NAD(P)/FAD-dependent oxidoreductase [Candidatus Omnitrophica bacterium]|nr:NAD(P)/FAD-dependent oxidoreductase [Candidatus Omnitrophota bacterium]